MKKTTPARTTRSFTDKTGGHFRPPWIRARVFWGEEYNRVSGLIRDLGLNSVCVEAACPNRGECWNGGYVTFMVMGDICTRGCRFCNIAGGRPTGLDKTESGNIARAVKELGMKYAVITSVTRDDLSDRGAGHFVDTVRTIKATTPEVDVELLIPDMGGYGSLISRIAFSGARVIGHNIEIPEALYPQIRKTSDYSRSLEVLEILNSFKEEAGIFIKSSMILGLGERYKDIFRTLEELKDRGVDIVYIGQYLSPSRDNWPVKKYYSPEEFALLEQKVLGMGFGALCVGAMVRSSYRARDSYLSCFEQYRSKRGVRTG